MAEFKKLSEVEQIESVSDNATVLVEDGGEIKRVSKSAVGGAGGYVIKLSESHIEGEFYVLEENYDELYDVLMAGGSVWADCTDAPEAAAPTSLLSAPYITNYGPDHKAIAHWRLTDIGLILLDAFDSFAIRFPNGSHNLEPNVGDK